MCGRNRQPKPHLAAALITSFIEHQAQRNRGLPPAEESPTSMPQMRGITGYEAAHEVPAYETSINPNPPSYEEIANDHSYVQQQPRVINEKQKRNVNTAASHAPLPPHEYEGYSPNTGIEETGAHLSRHASASSSNTRDENEYRFTPDMAQFPQHVQQPKYPSEILPRLISAITIFFDAKIHMHQDHPGKVRHLENRKAKKIKKLTRKYEDKIARGKDIKFLERMDKRTAKMERWTENAVRTYEAYQERQAQRGYGRGAYGHHANGGCRSSYPHGQSCGANQGGFGRQAALGVVRHAPQMTSSMG